MDRSKYTNWFKSRRSGGGDNCVEVAFAVDGMVGVRDSKDPTGPMIEIDAANWVAFIDAVRDGGLDA